MIAPCQGHDSVVELLLRREDVNPNMLGKDGVTPLSLAAYHWYDRVVELLLAREDLSPDMPDIYGVTPLSLAASLGHNRAVELLLGHKTSNQISQTSMA